MAKARGQRVLYPLLFSHDVNLPIGGIVDASEDGRGLKVEGVIALDVRAGRDAWGVLKRGFVNGLSIGYKVDQSTYDAGGTRHLKAINLKEVSLVVFPANPSAGVSGLS
jgi:HK97 family phage prohead protease